MAQFIRIMILNLLWVILSCWAVIHMFGWTVFLVLNAWFAFEALVIYWPVLRNRELRAQAGDWLRSLVGRSHG
jgi:cyanate permease